MKNYYSLRTYWSYLSRYKLRLLLVFLLFSLSDVFLSVVPIFIGRLVGAAAEGTEAPSQIWNNVIILVAMSSLHDVTWRLSELSFLRYIMHIPFDFESDMFRKVIQKPYPYFVGKFTGKTASYIMTLRKELEDLLDKVMWEYANLVVTTTIITSILFSVNIATGMVFLAGLLMMYASGKYAIKNNLKYEAKYTDVDSTKNGKMIDVISNFVNVKSYRKESKEYETFLAEQRGVLFARKRSFKWAIVFWATMSLFVRHIIWPITIVMNVHFFLNGSISLAELTTLLSTILVFSDFIWRLIWEVSQFSLRAARIEEAHRYLFGKKVVELDDDQETSSGGQVFDHQLSLEGLTFAYPDQPSQVVLDGIDMSINKGEKVGIVGKSGSGKTTLVKLLLGYYPIDSGRIVLDGESLSSEALLHIISYVPQDTTLFNRTIADNIAYAVNERVSQEEILEVSKKALAHEFIEKIPEQYKAIVGERGVKLSTGQRQRIAIARAMLQDKPLLILDEATSALDSENEVLVQKSLENLWKDRAVISIAHRLSTLKKMDRILVFDKGKIVEDGSIDELLKKKGAFYDLWNHQVNGMIIE